MFMGLRYKKIPMNSTLFNVIISKIPLCLNRGIISINMTKDNVENVLYLLKLRTTFNEHSWHS